MTETTYYTAAQAADRLHISVRALLQKVRDGQVPASKFGGKWLFTDADITAAVAKSHTDNAAPKPKRGSARQRRRAS